MATRRTLIWINADAAGGRYLSNMTDALTFVVSQCGAGGGALLGLGLLGGMFLTGAAGSFVHCVPMCGPFVLGQAADRMACIPAASLRESRRIGAGLLLPYHAGRLLTYAGLGAAAGSLGMLVGRLPWLDRIAGALLLAAAVGLSIQAVRRMRPRSAARSGASPGWVARGCGCVRRTRGFSLGVLLGFLPCGFLYGALAVATASGSTARGAAAMVAFGAGTMPALIAVGVAGRAIGPRWGRAAPAMLAFNAVLLGGLAWTRLAG